MGLNITQAGSSELPDLQAGALSFAELRQGGASR